MSTDTLKMPAIPREAWSDEYLWDRFEGERREDDFEELVARHWDTSYRLALACLGDSAAAEDTTQLVFLRVASAAADCSGPGSFRAWLRTLVLNAVRDLVRKDKRREAREERAARLRASRTEEEHDCLGEGVLHEQVRECVAHLPEDLREAVNLRFFEGLSYRDVAEALGCPVGTASSRIRRGLEQLRRRFRRAS